MKIKHTSRNKVSEHLRQKDRQRDGGREIDWYGGSERGAAISRWFLTRTARLSPALATYSRSPRVRASIAQLPQDT